MSTSTAGIHTLAGYATPRVRVIESLGFNSSKRVFVSCYFICGSNIAGPACRPIPLPRSGSLTLGADCSFEKKQYS